MTNRLSIFVYIVIGGVVAVEVVGICVIGVVVVVVVVVIVVVVIVVMDLYIDVRHTRSSAGEGRVHHDTSIHIVMGDALVDELLYVGR